jgi:hypothetical protein
MKPDAKTFCKIYKRLYVDSTKGVAVKVRDLERLLKKYGAGHSTVDTITRKLFEANRLPKGGRGDHAPRIGATEAAAILAAIAASDPASDADERIAEVDQLRLAKHRKGKDALFLSTLANILSSPSSARSVVEVRIGRNVNRAEIQFEDGAIDLFEEHQTNDFGRKVFRTEGVLPGPLLVFVAQVLAGEAEPPKYRELGK